MPRFRPRATLLLLLLGAVGLWAAPPSIRISGTGAAVGILRQLAENFGKVHPGLRVEVLPSIGSSGGIRAVADRKLDLACSSRSLTAAEAALGLREVVFGRTPFVFGVRASNPVNDLSLEAIHRALDGTVMTWPSGEHLRVILRPRSDSAHQYMAGLSPRMAAALDQAHARPGLFIAMTDQDCASQIERTPGALGPCTLGLILAERRSIKPLSVDGVAPTLDNLAAGSYPYAITISLVLPQGPPSSQVRAFLAFLERPATRDLLRRSGYLVPPSTAKGPR